MTRLLGLLVLLFPAALRAETVWETQEDDVTVVRITATPADAPSPLLKYRFELPPMEQVEGNAAVDYRRAFAEGGIGQVWRGARKEWPSSLDDGGQAGVEDWYSTEVPLSALPLEQLASASARFDDSVDGFARRGASRRRCDWELYIQDLTTPEVVSLLLPEFQELRSLSRAVALQTRFALAERRFQDAAELMRINYTMGRHAGNEPLLICSLIGMALCSTADQNALELIGAPGSPNLYWALTQLPTPLVPIRDAMVGELDLAARSLPILRVSADETKTYDEWNALWNRSVRSMVEMLPLIGAPDPPPLAVELLPTFVAAAGYAHAKARLAAWGYSAEQVEAMPVGQVLGLYTARVHREIIDRQLAAASVPFSVGRPLYAAAEKRLRNQGPLGSDPDHELLPMDSMLLPALGAARGAEVRLDRQIAALRVLEALRMHAAQNDGVLPGKLKEVTCVPIPLNPATGKAFEYKLVDAPQGPTAIVTLPNSDGVPGNWRYELTIVAE
ncbi:hypothetical protein Pla175_25450 [Pirellulimonas nuda]|uniref:Uncharacterized protein n=1 Tax=Pirellulimonas nuda TaxID=2528009 RepID=A0A518DCE5_9BACT|nr:hypothetical protein [Pirellulimonas nuda]QDU89158.1 hypothetical protein Pla175_25450 [Pirellulimonas nuda]